LDSIQKGFGEMSVVREVPKRVPDRTYEVDGFGNVEAYLYQYRVPSERVFYLWGAEPKPKRGMPQSVVRVKNAGGFEPNGGMTVAVVVNRGEDGIINDYSIGTAVCSQSDKFKAAVGRKIAVARAIEALEDSGFSGPAVEDLPTQLHNTLVNIYDYWARQEDSA
jgi:hypothetical protein